MNRVFLALFLLLPLTIQARSTAVYFSPDGGCTKAVVQSLDAAKKSVWVQAYSFTSSPIAKAIMDAKKRGLDVEVLLDKSNVTARYSAARFLSNVGIPVFIDDKHAIAHNKVMVIDGHVVITGSFNFTTAAEHKNAENLLIIDSKRIAAKYAENWRAHRVHSTLFLN